MDTIQLASTHYTYTEKHLTKTHEIYTEIYIFIHTNTPGYSEIPIINNQKQRTCLSPADNITKNTHKCFYTHKHGVIPSGGIQWQAY